MMLVLTLANYFVISLFVSLQLARVGAKSTWGKIRCLPEFIPSRNQISNTKT